jgi:hypothetical protein
VTKEEQMTGVGRWVFEEPAIRHAFTLSQVIGSGTRDERYDLLGVVQVNVGCRGPEPLAEHLRTWAVATLAARVYGFGRYYASLGPLDEDGEPAQVIAEEDVDWSGTTPPGPSQQCGTAARGVRPVTTARRSRS